jgi:hypothetical protein
MVTLQYLFGNVASQVGATLGCDKTVSSESFKIVSGMFSSAPSGKSPSKSIVKFPQD